MAAKTLAQHDVDEAIQRLVRAQGALTCAVMVLDKEVTGSPLFEVSEAMHGVIDMITSSYCTLNNAELMVVEAQA